MESVARWLRHPRMVLGILALIGASPYASDIPSTSDEATSAPMSTPREKEECINLYVQCKQECWVGRCDDCLNKCTAQGKWDYKMCRKREPR